MYQSHGNSSKLNVDQYLVIHQPMPLTNQQKQVYLALQSRDELTILAEDSQVEVVVVVSDGDLSSSVDADSNRIVCDT